MATKKNPITGSTTKRSSAKGSLTGSKRFETPDVTSNNLIQSVASNVSSRANTLTESVKSLGNSRNTSFDVSTHRSFSGQSHTEALSKANTIAKQYGIEQIDIGSLLGSDPYSADSNIPEMTAAEANKNKLKLQRQSNAIEVRHEKIKLGRKAVKMATEQVGLVGDLVDYATAGIDTATKVVKNEIASVKFQTEQSKLVQTEEFFTQQQIATDGTIALTDGPVTSVVFSPNGNTIATGSWDHTVKLWNLSGQLPNTLQGHSGQVTSVVFSPDGNTIATGSEDNTVKLWNINLDDLLRRGCAWVDDYLKNDPNVKDDRHFCDDIAKTK